MHVESLAKVHKIFTRSQNDLSLEAFVQGLFGWGPGQPDSVTNLVDGNPDHSRGVGTKLSFGTKLSLRSLPIQVIL